MAEILPGSTTDIAGYKKSISSLKNLGLTFGQLPFW